MNINDYQKEAARTLIYEPGFEISGKDMMLIWCSIGLSGESGEVAEKIKKGIFHQHGLDKEQLKKEIGDCCWYLASLCTLLEVDFSEILELNIEKLKIRYPNGYSSEDSQKRVDIE